MALTTLMFAFAEAAGTAIIAAGTAYSAYSLSSATSYISKKLRPPSTMDKVCQIYGNSKEVLVAVAGVVTAGIIVYNLCNGTPQQNSQSKSTKKLVLKDRRNTSSIGAKLRRKGSNMYDAQSQSGGTNDQRESSGWSVDHGNGLIGNALNQGNGALP